MAFLLCASLASSEPVSVRHTQGFLHGFIVLKDMDGKILASGDLTQSPAGNRITTVMSLHFKDGSLFQQTAIYSQRRIFQLQRFKELRKGPAFKTQESFSFDTSTGKVSVDYTDEDGKAKTIVEKMPLPNDLANGIVSILLTNVDPKVETTLSMLVTTPKPRVVKLKIASLADLDSYSVGGIGAKAVHYVIKIDIGGVTGVIAKVIGKQPPPVDIWIAAGSSPAFLKSEGQLFEDGPIWRIELASPVWSKAPGQEK